MKHEADLSQPGAAITVSEGLHTTDAHEAVARAFHETYEDLAPQFGWETQERSRVEWGAVPEENRDLMVAVVASLANRGVIQIPAANPDPEGEGDGS